MRGEIVRFLKDACQRYKLNANYIPDGDIWVVHKGGRAVQNFTTDQFYQMPKRARLAMYEPLVRIGLNNNLSNVNHDQFFLRGKKFGRKLA